VKDGISKLLGLKTEQQPFLEIFFTLELPKMAVCGWLMADCGIIPFLWGALPVQQAVNSPVPCSYGNLRPPSPILERKRA